MKKFKNFSALLFSCFMFLGIANSQALAQSEHTTFAAPPIRETFDASRDKGDNNQELAPTSNPAQSAFESEMPESQLAVGGASKLTPITNFTTSLSAITCTNGKMTVTVTSVTGGDAPYTYSKDGGLNYLPSPVFLAVSPGTYTFAVKDANGSTLSMPVVVNPALSVAASSTPAVCYGNTNGSVSAAPTGGYPAYTYQWAYGLTVIGTTATVSNLGAGAYKVTVTDMMGCTKSATTRVSQPPLLKVTLTATKPLCNGQTTGAVTSSPAGGTAPYTYAWSYNSLTTQNLTAIGAGTYTVTVTDAHGCTVSASKPVFQPAPIYLSLSTSAVLCFGGTTGTAKVLAAGGTGAKTYLWSNFSPLNTIINLAAGPYTVTVTDTNGCTASGSVVVNQPPPLVINSIVFAPAGANYTVTVSASGGVPPLKYSRQPLAGGPLIFGSPSGVFTNVPAGAYTFKVTDKNLCFTTQPKTIPLIFNDDRSKQDLGENFTLVPNPAQGSVQLAFDDKMPTTGTVELRDATGRLLKQMPVSSLIGGRISLDDCSAGVLFVTFRPENGTPLTKRLVLIE